MDGFIYYSGNILINITVSFVCRRISILKSIWFIFLKHGISINSSLLTLYLLLTIINDFTPLMAISGHVSDIKSSFINHQEEKRNELNFTMSFVNSTTKRSKVYFESAVFCNQMNQSVYYHTVTEICVSMDGYTEDI